MYLLDTHTLIWTLFGNNKLSKVATDTILGNDIIFVSVASLWEIAIKQSIGKINISYSSAGLADLCAQENFIIMPIEPMHLDAIKSLPQIHRDPFDRLLIAQAKTEHLTLITKDEIIRKYDIETLW